ncbi:nucleotide sugar dehydrogenase [uncultured Phascolarctobacterium sp.]|jgi:UDP-N-acetyl-D-galactosamine dehydrogenase|uniref:nucleotide sugar dehydrogenase n=1 Tax=uncultured Phascolarctobacterium sp. TaxID=512296 RepID=UPI0015A7E3CE|nr:nucleotide sugar dehydrogenase [uncultured Phascolarctobacterium sp.]
MQNFKNLIEKKATLSVIGLGYVGMPLAIAFAEHVNVTGFDLNKEKIFLYKSGIDPTNEVGNEKIQKTTINFTTSEEQLKNANFHIIAVPTPINQDKTPDFSPIIGASTILGRNLTPGSIIVYESTVYPGVTEDICIPILEKTSGLKCGVDFKVGYSPERINPGDKLHRLENIKKIVSGIDQETLNEIASVYELVIKAGVYRASSIKVAEAAKVAENSQRDINIAFMNELAMAFDKMHIDTNEVVDAMNTKWNALGFRPGLVGGHCIGVDPYYFVYEAEKLGYHSQIILAGRQINDGMGTFIADAIIKQLVLAGKKVLNAKVAILGITFKENCPDVRNSKVIDIIKRLNEYGILPDVIDPWADIKEVKNEYHIDLKQLKDIQNIDCLVLAVAHNEFKTMNLQDMNSFFKNLPNSEKVFIDLKNICSLSELTSSGYNFWRL